MKKRSFSGGVALAAAMVIGFWSLAFGAVVFKKGSLEYDERGAY